MNNYSEFQCPRCGDNSLVFPALSRTDNKTHVCSGCGVEEALEQFVGALQPQVRWAVQNV